MYNLCLKIVVSRPTEKNTFLLFIKRKYKALANCNSSTYLFVCFPFNADMLWMSHMMEVIVKMWRSSGQVFGRNLFIICQVWSEKYCRLC